VTSKPRWFASNDLDAAFGIARACHANKTRKTDDTPYISHLMGVAALVTEHGGSEVQAAAGLLHDIIEDTPMTYDRLALLVGTAVADIVLDCTDDADRKRDDNFSPEQRLADWHDRKVKYLDRLAHKPNGTPSLLVVLADKVHNGEATARDIQRCRAEGRDLAEFWGHFIALCDKQHWWYGELLATLESKTWPETALPLLDRFRTAVGIIRSA
jgi:(p)ppGpp synthase/HD superfamily hydrolase